MIDLVKKHLADYSAGNWNEYKAACADKIVYEEKSTLQRVQGRDECLKAVQRWKTAFPDLAAKVTTIFASGDKVVAEVEWEGTHKGVLEGPFGTIQPTGRRGKLAAVEVFTIKDNKIVEAHHYFDLMTMLAQIGITPRLGAEAATAHPV